MQLTNDIANGIIIFMFAALQLICVAVACATDQCIEKRRKGVMIALVILSFLLVLRDFGEAFFTEFRFIVKWRTFFAALGYMLRPVIIVLFACFIDPKRNHVAAWVIAGINLLLYTTPFYADWVFTITEENTYVGGPLVHTCLIVSAILLAYIVFVAIREFKVEKRKGIFIPMLFTAIVVAGIVLDIIKDPWVFHWIGYVTLAVVECSVFFYMWLHFVLERRYKEATAAEERYKTMISQLQPHFIYNTLSAISAIKDMPVEGKKAINDFSLYLRQNLDAMTVAEIVPFEKELDHINKYIELEKLRFDDKINVVYDIQWQNFSVPFLVVQLLVENAVKHGITQKDEGGTVYVSTEKDADHYIITVRDDGIGFDMGQEISGSHFGVNNIRRRLEYAVNGTLDLQSEVGKGTTAKVMIPIKK